MTSINQISVDVSKVLSDRTESPLGIVTCWLLDSDKKRARKRSFEEALKDLGAKCIRFPYGRLANNYLWTTPPFSDEVNGLKPAAGSLAEPPGMWSWAVREDKSFINDMDFDEYIDICRRVGAEPIVVINVQSFKYEGGPSYELLKETAAEWVRYSNLTRNYGVKYWQLGNEQDHRHNTVFLSPDEYLEVYKDFTQAMKKVDPGIKTGPALISNTDIYGKLFEYCPENIDYISIHQYLYGQPFVGKGYEVWKEYSGDVVKNIGRLTGFLKSIGRPDMEILMTEFNSSGALWYSGDEKNIPDLQRTLCFFQMAGEILEAPNIKYATVWNSHSPWKGEYEDDQIPNILDLDNELKPNGKIMKIINDNLHEKMVQIDREAGYIRSFASYSPGSGKLTLFILNKNNAEEDINIVLKRYQPAETYEKWVFTGSGPYDLSPGYIQKGKIEIGENELNTTLDPLSVTVINLENKENLL